MDLFYIQDETAIGLLPYEPEMYTVSEALIGRATGGGCKIKAGSSRQGR